MSYRIAILVAVSLGSCGDDDDFDPGRGSGTLLVSAAVEYEGGGASARVSVVRAGNGVGDATVRVFGGDEEISLRHDGGGIYRGSLAGWRGRYALSVSAGPDGEDHLTASLAAPDPPVLTQPAPGIAFDPRLAEGGMVEVRWSGDRAMRIRVRTNDYDPGFTDDAGRVLIASTFFEEDRQELRLERENHVDLAGGAPGSRLTTSIESKHQLIILNPF
jgi:hypothetical protein